MGIRLFFFIYYLSKKTIHETTFWLNLTRDKSIKRQTEINDGGIRKVYGVNYVFDLYSTNNITSYFSESNILSCYEGGLLLVRQQ